MKRSILSKALQCDVPERILLVEDIWDSITESPEEIPLSESQRNELDQRLKAYKSNPKTGKSWDIVKKRIKRTRK
jgi:putative addiction module component (TIGR02574 family)